MSRRGRRVRRVAAGAAAAAVVVLAGAGPAAAKGPEEMTIGMPGGPTVVVSAEEGARVDELHELFEGLGGWELTGEGAALLPDAPTEHLGPALRVEWTMYNAIPANADYAPRVIQDVYPFAAGGPLVFTGPGQRVFASDVTVGGWFRAPDRLVADLADLGITSAIVVAPSAVAGSASSPSGAAGGVAAAAPGGGWQPVAAAVAAAMAAAVLVAMAIRRGLPGAPAATG